MRQIEARQNGHGSYGRHPFDRSGLAALSDLHTPEWMELFEALEREQAEFLAVENQFRSLGYQWPRDALHTWSRVWEYPYVYHHLKTARARWPDSQPMVVDLGSGVTFFPFALARLGYCVTCADIDAVCGKDVLRAAEVISPGPGKVNFQLIEAETLPFDDNECDVIVCVSVLEHIPSFEQVVCEMARILKPGGVLLLTVDLDLRGDAEIGTAPHRRLMSSLQQHFTYLHQETTIHPRDILDSSSGPCALKGPTGLGRMWFSLKQGVKPFLGRKPSPRLAFFLAVHGFVLTKPHKR